MIGISAPTGAVKGFEYLIHFEKERERSEEFENSRYFIRHTGKYHIVKLEQRKQALIEQRLKEVIDDEVKDILNKLNYNSGWIYGDNKPKNSRHGYSHQGSFLKGLGFK